MVVWNKCHRNNLVYIVTIGKTPDGYDVNADGQWTINGVVQTIGAAVAQAAGQ